MGTFSYNNPDGHPFWYEPNFATNEVGFSALPGGQRYPGMYSDGTIILLPSFSDVGIASLWWSATEDEFEKDEAEYWGIEKYSNALFSYFTEKLMGFSVRCVRDAD
jgi:uncharacterized protein (TIGR02145 family)